jgi:hypothetical protein
MEAIQCGQQVIPALALERATDKEKPHGAIVAA